MKASEKLVIWFQVRHKLFLSRLKVLMNMFMIHF